MGNKGGNVEKQGRGLRYGCCPKKQKAGLTGPAFCFSF